MTLSRYPIGLFALLLLVTASVLNLSGFPNSKNHPTWTWWWGLICSTGICGKVGTENLFTLPKSDKYDLPFSAEQRLLLFLKERQEQAEKLQAEKQRLEQQSLRARLERIALYVGLALTFLQLLLYVVTFMQWLRGLWK